MSIKDLFSKPASFQNAETGSSDVESFEYIKIKNKQQQTFQPHVDFSSASNFAKYGSAYEYYTQAVERIYGEYPYDGSKKERIIFEISSSYLDKYVFDKRYPKTNGYIHFSRGGWGTAASITKGYGLPNSSNDYEYIYSRGGIHTASAGMKGKPLYETFSDSVIYHTSSNRAETYDISGSKGFTVEFWLKKQAFDIAKTEKEVIFDLWNGNLSSSHDYGRVTLILTSSATAGANPFRITLQSGSTGVFEATVGSTSITTSSLGNWAHYAISLVSASSGITSRLYQNGNLDDERNLGTTGFGNFPGLVNCYIGALQTNPSGNIYHKLGLNLAAGAKLSASLDDFRFWKKRRTSKQIYNNWYKPVYGGTNTDDANTDLGVYYKFNEGITSTASIDSVVLDYSGRIANGIWNGYSSGARDTNSAMVESGLVTSEEKDPIIYSEHSEVSNLLSELQTSGSEWDSQNSMLLYNTMPQWIREEDDASNKNVKYLFQIMSSYFDTLHAQITELPKLKQKIYPSSSHKPLPFADRLLSEKGFVVPNLFINSNILEKFEGRDFNKVQYEKELNDTKNLIYTNIYNNLEHIYKSKGTERSIRNMLRCFGIDDEIVKLNVYTDKGTHYFNDVIKHSSVTKTYLNFNQSASYFQSTIFQTSSTNHSLTCVSGSDTRKLERHSAFTAEADIIVPYKIPEHKKGYFITDFITSSVFGMHEATMTPSDYDWTGGAANFQVYLERDKIESTTARFRLTNEDGTINLTSSYFNEIFDNQRWNLAVSVRPEKYPFQGGLLKPPTTSYIIEFYGIHHAFEDANSEFLLSSSISQTIGERYLTKPKRFYAGAEYTNFTSSLKHKSDLKFGGFRFYQDYLDSSIISQHNLDPTNIGLDKGYRAKNLFNFESSGSHIPSYDLMAINWDFSTVTGSDNASLAIIEDASSGSTDTIYGWMDNIIRREHRAKLLTKGIRNVSDFVSYEHIFSSKKELPEIAVASNNIFIKGEKETHLIKDEDVSDNFYSLEKSMYQVISEEMINMFSTITEFNNLVGQPVDRYRVEYKDMKTLRRLFFEKNSGNLDFDRFTEYFKWIDVSISRMVEQLFPLNARFSSGISDVIDSHILERNKYQNKFPLLTRHPSTEGSAKGHSELKYNWKTGHAPLVNDENQNCLWQKDRSIRTNISDRENIRKVILNHNNANSQVLAKSDGTVYRGSTYALRALSKPYSVEKDLRATIHGGINYDINKDRDIIHNFVERHGDVNHYGAPSNVFVAGISGEPETVKTQICDDEKHPLLKEKLNVRGYVGKYASAELIPISASTPENSYLYTFGIEKMPINIVSGSVNSGYNSIVYSQFNPNAIVTNIHSDTTTFTNDIPMQGPFTQNWVGGHQHRHVELNCYDAGLIDQETGAPPKNKLHNEYTREEAWQMMFAEYPATSSTDGAIGFVGADYGGPYPDISRKLAVYYREGRAKRPVNIKNIKTTVTNTSPFFSLGNYKENYEIVQSFGKKENNLYLRKNPEQTNFLPTAIASILPETTHPMSLVGIDTSSFGNVFGKHNNNRQPDSTSATYDVVNTIITGSATNSIITCRFSAPGGIEVSSLGYLDVYAREYSVHNNINYRNLSVRGSGSGEAGTIRSDSPHGKREGLQTLLSRHAAQFGEDSNHQIAVAAGTNVVQNPNFHKTNRNTRRRPSATTTRLISPAFKLTRDNAYVTSLIPQSDFQYAWITSSLGGSGSINGGIGCYGITSGKQRIYDYAPRDGILSSSIIIGGDSGFVPAINFPTASEIYGE